MSKLITILTNLYAGIRDSTIDIEPLVHSNTNEELAKAMFDVTVSDSDVSQTITTKSPVSGITYTVTLRQNGGLVNANVIVNNTTATNRGAGIVFSFKVSDFVPEATDKMIFGTCSTNLSYECKFILNTVGLYIASGNLIANSSYTLNFTYNIQ